MMNPAHLDLFRAVLRHGGMTRAATALGVGQPHISRAIAQLEADLGFALFVRGHGSATPTPEGEAFAKEVAQTYAGLDQLQQAARHIRERGTGSLRVACQPSLAARLLPRAIRRFSDACPDVHVSVHVPGPDTIWSWTASGQCDIGLARPRSGFAGVEVELFSTVEAVCAVPQRHRLARQRVIRVQDLAGEALIAGAAGAFQASVDAAFVGIGIVPRIVATAQYTTARCGLVAENLGVAIVDPVAARQLSGLPIVLRPFLPAIAIETVLLRPAGQPPSRIALHLMALIRAERDALLASLPTGPDISV